MAIVILVILGICGYVWWKTRHYRKFNDVNNDLTNAHVDQASNELKDQLTEINKTESTHVSDSTTED